MTKCRSKGSPRQETRTLIGQRGLPTYITLFRWAEDTVGSQPISGRWTPDFASMAELIPVADDRIRKKTTMIIKDVNDVGSMPTRHDLLLPVIATGSMQHAYHVGR